MSKTVVHMLWVNGNLDTLGAICISSFIRKGYSVWLWSYNRMLASPPGARVLDAREVLPEEAIFLNQQGSFAGFSDLFRYAVLRKFGGLYSDVDVVALRPAYELPECSFLVLERTPQNQTKINGNIIRVLKPEPGNIIDLAFSYANTFPKNKITWSEIGPSLLTAIAAIYPQHGFEILPPEFCNSIDWWNCPERLLTQGPAPTGHFLHLYNEMWRKKGISKDIIPQNSVLENSIKAEFL